MAKDDPTPTAKKAALTGKTGVVTLQDGTRRPATITDEPITEPLIGTDKANITTTDAWKGCVRASVHMPGGWVETIVALDEPRKIGGGYVPAFTAA